MRRVAVLVLVVGALACSGSSPSASSSGTSAATTPSTSTSASASTPPDNGTVDWEKVSAPSGCECSDGSEFHWWLHRGDPARVLFLLQGGGACFDASTCAPGSVTFTHDLKKDARPGGGGVFNLERADNPFHGWSIVVVPYCTGDLHLGDAVHDYGGGVVVHHKGQVNATAALDATVAAFPAATEVVVAGLSAGSAGAPLYGGLAHDRLPQADIVVLADGSGAYPGTARAGTVGSVWGVADHLPDWPESKGAAAADWSVPGLVVQAGRHDPDLRVATINNAYDSVQTFFTKLVGADGDLLGLIDANNAAIEAAGVTVHSWVAPGTQHTVLTRSEFYSEVVDGTALRDWVAGLVAGTAVPDVHCTACQ